MPVERAADHPTFENAGNTITSLVAPARGSEDVALFRADIPPGGGIPRHRHDRFDVFVLLVGGVTFHLGDDTIKLVAGDSAVVPTGVRHGLEAGPEGASILVAMLPNTMMIRDDDSEVIPDWVR